MSCLNHIHICNASCCRSFSFQEGSFKPRIGLNKLQIHLTKEQIRYYELHACTYQHGILYIPIFLDNKFEIKNEKIIIYRDCEALENNLCTIQLGKPFCCKDLNETTKHKYRLTENCRFKAIK